MVEDTHIDFGITRDLAEFVINNEFEESVFD